MKCENCGTEFKESDSFCRKCGSAKYKKYVRVDEQNIEIVESLNINQVEPIKILDEEQGEVLNDKNEKIYEEIEKAEKKSRSFIIAGIVALFIILLFVIVIIIAITYSIK